MNVLIGETHEQYAAEFCLRVAFRKLKVGDIELAIERTEDALRSLNELKKLKEKTD